ncbi:MAG: dihydroorotate dehydrogenase [Acidobacteriota bacterium]
MGVDLSVSVGAVRLQNPLLLASGCCGYGLDMEPFLDLARLGGVCLKGLSLSGSEGNPPPRIWETKGGMINAIGLQNIGVEAFLKEKAPLLRKVDTVFVANFYGHTVEEYAEAARLLGGEPCLGALEMNVSCPNIQAGGIHFGTDPAVLFRVTEACRKATEKPLWVKLSPNVSDPVAVARAAEAAGADALSCTNTLPAMAIDVERRTFRIHNKVGGLSGPALKPVALRIAYQVSRAVKIPVVGIGGIATAEDALEFLLAGAAAFQVGTALFVDPACPYAILDGIEDYCRRHGFSGVQALRGALREEGAGEIRCSG